MLLSWVIYDKLSLRMLIGGMFVHQQEEHKSLQACWINIHTTPYQHNTVETKIIGKGARSKWFEKRGGDEHAFWSIPQRSRHPLTPTYSAESQKTYFMVNYKNILSFSETTCFLQASFKADLG